MKDKSKALLILLVIIAISFPVKAQDYSEQAKIYFSKYIDNNAFFNLSTNSLPSLDDCKLVFKGKNAYTFFGYIEDLKNSLKKKQKKNLENYADIKIESLTTAEIERGKGTGGMKSIIDKLQPKVTFYSINMLRVKGDDYGVAYNYWVKIDNRWVFFPKPWIPFS